MSECLSCQGLGRERSAVLTVEDKDQGRVPLCWPCAVELGYRHPLDVCAFCHTRPGDRWAKVRGVLKATCKDCARRIVDVMRLLDQGLDLGEIKSLLAVKDRHTGEEGDWQRKHDR